MSILLKLACYFISYYCHFLPNKMEANKPLNFLNIIYYILFFFLVFIFVQEKFSFDKWKLPKQIISNYFIDRLTEREESLPIWYKKFTYFCFILWHSFHSLIVLLQLLTSVQFSLAPSFFCGLSFMLCSK